MGAKQRAQVAGMARSIVPLDSVNRATWMPVCAQSCAILHTTILKTQFLKELSAWERESEIKLVARIQPAAEGIGNDGRREPLEKGI